MKRTILPALVILFFSITTQAQVNKGDLLLGASLGYSSNNDNGSNTNSNTNVSPRISLGIGRNAVMGLSTRFGYHRTKSASSPNKQVNISFGGSLFWKKYFTIKNRLGWYLQPEGTVSTSKATYYNSTTKTSQRSTSYGATVVPGFYYQALPKLLLNADIGGVGISRTIYKSDGAAVISRSTSVNASFLNYFTFGVDFILGK